MFFDKLLSGVTRKDRKQTGSSWTATKCQNSGGKIQNYFASRKCWNGHGILFYSKPQINFFRSIWNFWRKLLGIIFQQMKFPLFSPNEFILKRSRFWPTGYSFINFCTFFYFIDTRWQNKPWRMLFGNQFSKAFFNKKRHSTGLQKDRMHFSK